VAGNRSDLAVSPHQGQPSCISYWAICGVTGLFGGDLAPVGLGEARGRAPRSAAIGRRETLCTLAPAARQHGSRHAFLTQRAESGNVRRMTKKRLLLIAALPFAIVVILGVMAMLPPRSEHHDRIKLGMTRAEISAIFEQEPWLTRSITGTSFSDIDLSAWSNDDERVWVRFNMQGKAISIAVCDHDPYEKKTVVDEILWLMR